MNAKETNNEILFISKIGRKKRFIQSFILALIPSIGFFVFTLYVASWSFNLPYPFLGLAVILYAVWSVTKENNEYVTLVQYYENEKIIVFEVEK